MSDNLQRMHDSPIQLFSMLMGMGYSFIRMASSVDFTHAIEVFLYGSLAAAGSYLGTKILKTLWALAFKQKQEPDKEEEKED